MGITISSEATLAPITLASTLIGFISFAFTLATALRVFWDNMYATFYGAPSEINDMLTNLRQALYEERSNLRRARVTVRRRRASAAAKGEQFGSNREGLTPEDALQAMSTAVKDMIRSFKAFEKPFLVQGLQVPQRRRSKNEREDTMGYSSGGLGEDEHSDYLYAMNRYRKCTFKQRFIWIRVKSKILALMDAIVRIEVRRIGFQTSWLAMQMRGMFHELDDFQDRLDGLDRMEQRLSRIVGVRRLE